MFVLLAIAAWSYGPIIVSLSHTLRTSDDYSAGQLVPLAAIFFVWHKRKTLKETQVAPCWAGGIGLLVLAEAARLYGYLSMRQSIERYAIAVAVAGIVLLVAGRQVFRRVICILLFLFLMVPLPGVVYNLISLPLQRQATTASVYLLEVVVPDVSQEGNIVVLGEDMHVAVTEACSGLRMLTAFIIVAAFIAFMVKRARWQKAALLAMSIPVAVICNVLRIFVTGALSFYVSEELAGKFFHDFAGLVMMPVAVSLLFAGLRLTDRLIVPETGTQEKTTVIRAKSVRTTSPTRLPA